MALNIFLQLALILILILIFFLSKQSQSQDPFAKTLKKITKLLILTLKSSNSET